VFFQAEDGIRDDLVTGVQTCALPISVRGLAPNPATEYERHRLRGDGLVVLALVGAQFSRRVGDLGRVRVNQLARGPSDVSRRQRSEERRVGKECGAGWGAGAAEQQEE